MKKERYKDIEEFDVMTDFTEYAEEELETDLFKGETEESLQYRRSLDRYSEIVNEFKKRHLLPQPVSCPNLSISLDRYEDFKREFNSDYPHKLDYVGWLLRCKEKVILTEIKTGRMGRLSKKSKRRALSTQTVVEYIKKYCIIDTPPPKRKSRKKK